VLEWPPSDRTNGFADALLLVTAWVIVQFQRNRCLDATLRHGLPMMRSALAWDAGGRIGRGDWVTERSTERSVERSI